MAHRIHELSRRPGSFFAVNCAAVPDELFEAEFFGHGKGAFTGGVGERHGAFEAADRGTLFLDEVGDLSLRSQAKLLRAVDTKKVRRLGESREREIDVRIICATNRPITPGSGLGFRPDLFFRLSELELRLEPLRGRPEDLLALSRRFCDEIGGEVQRPEIALSDDAIAVLKSHSWPGNIRELRRVLRGAIIETPQGEIVSAQAILNELHRMGTLDMRAKTASQTIDALTASAEQDPLLTALWQKHNGNISAVARELQTSRQNVQQKLARLGLRPASRFPGEHGVARPIRLLRSY